MSEGRGIVFTAGAAGIAAEGAEVTEVFGMAWLPVAFAVSGLLEDALAKRVAAKPSSAAPPRKAMGFLRAKVFTSLRSWPRSLLRTVSEKSANASAACPKVRSWGEPSRLFSAALRRAEEILSISEAAPSLTSSVFCVPASEMRLYASFPTSRAVSLSF